MTEQELQLFNDSNVPIALSSDDINDVRRKLQTFSERINSKPQKESIQKNKFANDSKYIPMSHIEMTLDEYYFGLWSIDKFEYKVIANEIVGSLELSVFHPVSRTWLRRTGAGAVQVKVKKNTDPMDIRNKIQNALVMDFPKLKAECLKNAAKSLGTIFGRDLNRKVTDEYSPLIPHKKQTASSSLDKKGQK